MQPSYTPLQKEQQAPNIRQNAQEKNIVLPISREPGRVPSQVPSADLKKIFYKHYKLWSRRAA